MLRCVNCKNPVDQNAATCPRCGRPKPGEEATVLQAVGIVTVGFIVLCFFGYQWLTDDKDNSDSAKPSATTQASMERPDSINNVEFLVDAILKPRSTHDAIVLYTGPRRTSQSIKVLPPGARVKTGAKDGDWIHIKTSDERIGYVLEKQLEFTDDAN